MSDTKVAVSAFVDSKVHQILREIADKEGRSLTKQVTYILTKYSEATSDDGA